VTTAKLNGLNPETYLRDILAKIADGRALVQDPVDGGADGTGRRPDTSTDPARP